MTLAPGETAASGSARAGGAFRRRVRRGSRRHARLHDARERAPGPLGRAAARAFASSAFATGLSFRSTSPSFRNPGPNADDPFFYVTELYGTVKVVTRAGAVFDYATGLLNFDPTGTFPGSGEKGLAGIVVEPAQRRPVRQRRLGRVPADRQPLPARHAACTAPTAGAP